MRGMMWLSEGLSYPFAANACFSVELMRDKCSLLSENSGSRPSTHDVHAMFTGGRAVVKISVRILLMRYSLTTFRHTMYAPAEAAAFPNVPTRKSICPMHPCSSAHPSQIGRASCREK